MSDIATAVNERDKLVQALGRLLAAHGHQQWMTLDGPNADECTCDACSFARGVYERACSRDATGQSVGVE